MSAMQHAAPHEPQPDADLSKLAPKFREAVEAALEECKKFGFDAVVYEAHRSMELQQLYYARGRTQIPPKHKVTNAKSNLYSWHGFGLAVDVIHRTKGWDAGDRWFTAVADTLKKHDMKWGGDWKMKDWPHFQWGACKPSPSDRARELYINEGIEAVWQAVGAT